MSNRAYAEASAQDRSHFIQCVECSEWIDCRSLDEVFFHEDHRERPDIQYSGSYRVRKHEAGEPL